MKIILSALLATLFFQIASGQSTCESAYMPFKEGVIMELSNYNKNDKITSSMTHTVSKVSNAGGDFVATISTKLKDKKGESIGAGGSYQLTCKGDLIIMDMQGMIDQTALASMGSMEVEMSGDGLFFPNELNVGDELEGGELNTKASLNGISLMKMNIRIDDRKVVGKESVTTPAGTFDCVKIEQTTSMSGMGSRTMKATVWFAKGVGMVKSENMDKKGNVDSKTVLTKFSK